MSDEMMRRMVDELRDMCGGMHHARQIQEQLQQIC